MGIHKTNERYRFWFLLSIGIILTSLTIFFSLRNTNERSSQVTEGVSEYQKETLTFVEKETIPSVTVYIADDQQKRTVGLAAIDSLGEHEGMLFLFDTDAPHSFWMKDMKYPIDIIWLNSSKEIVSIVENADPADFPLSYTPSSPARFVLEVNAGFTSEYEIKEGDRVMW